MADYIYVVQLEIPPNLENEFNRIYDDEHVPNIVKVAGVHGCTRYRLESGDDDGAARYLAIYEIDAADTTSTAAWKAASDTGEWVTKIRPNLTRRSHSTYKRLN